MAKLKGARQVVATVSSEEKAAFARAAGADVVLNYKAEDWVAKCMETTGGGGLDRIVEVDAAANVKSDLAAIRPEGQIVVYGSGAPEISVPFGPSILKNVRYSFFIVYNLAQEDRARAIADLNELLASNRLEHNIAVRLPLERIADAHELVEQGAAVGKVLLKVE
jgi:NADPH2:quinone reductase